MKEHIHIFDTTLRDGEQCPGAAMTVEQKVRIAMQLEALGVDVIEAGFPVISDGDFQAVRTVGGAHGSQAASAVWPAAWKKTFWPFMRPWLRPGTGGASTSFWRLPPFTASIR